MKAISLGLLLLISISCIQPKATARRTVMETGPIEVINPISWDEASAHIKSGKVTEIEFVTVGGIVLILDTAQKWFVHKPPVDVREFVRQNAPNAKRINIHVQAVSTAS
ncbi:MAG: hypothetical protein IPN91_01430 [Holophagaceae bacterium]|uniref:Uncharacterized protein n=1 Tax=Candidatus Geothrix odensensis TaxID=2954440 RepID=A0A936F194_9BACT|nr:hypothetical protein [Candidatus Geothrix odensensis]